MTFKTMVYVEQEMNHKNERIKKLLLKGMSPEQIAKKTGLPLARVLEGLARIEHGPREGVGDERH